MNRYSVLLIKNSYFFFIFFFEKPDHGPRPFNENKTQNQCTSRRTKGAMSVGTLYNHT